MINKNSIFFFFQKSNFFSSFFSFLFLIWILSTKNPSISGEILCLLDISIKIILPIFLLLANLFKWFCALLFWKEYAFRYILSFLIEKPYLEEVWWYISMKQTSFVFMKLFIQLISFLRFQDLEDLLWIQAPWEVQIFWYHESLQDVPSDLFYLTQLLVILVM